MSSSAIFILDLKGKTIISRNYRGDVDMGLIDRFLPLLMDREEDGLASPVFTEYFKDVEEESVRDNFVVIYELLDEMMDFGFPQTTESRILQEFITQEGHKLENAPRPPMAVTNAVSWRSEGIKYRKNEVFLDVIESVNMLANANGSVLQSEIVGCVKMRVYLTGMPELRLGLNDKVLFEGSGRGKSKSVELEDVKFHQCVRLSRFDNDRTISFIPPDGPFELMSYRLTTVVKPLIWIETNIERHSHSRVEFMIKAKSQFKRRSTANNVEIIIPVPSDADSPKFKTSIGTVKWQRIFTKCTLSLPSVIGEEVEGRPPIKVKFEIPYFTTSGIQMRHYTVYAPKFFQYICSLERDGSALLMLFPRMRITRLMTNTFSSSSKTISEKESKEQQSESASGSYLSGQDLLQRIVTELDKCGTKFVLPTSDPYCVEQLAQPLRYLSDIGTVLYFSYSILKILVESCGMTYEDSLRLFASNQFSYGDDLLTCTSSGVQAHVDVLVACHIESGPDCCAVVRKCPVILFARDPVDMEKAIAALKGFFSKKEISAIVKNTPEVLLKSVEELEEKYEYIFFQMCIEGYEFMDCSNWVTMDLNDIMMRHEFILKTGRYTTPDAKHPQIKAENPRLNRILDSSDDVFAVQVAGVTCEEWAVFRTFFEQLSNRRDKERSYERIKPSMRKAYERRRKEEIVLEDHVFDVALSHKE
ncbi:adaptor complexe medium subunit family protein [Dictyocaulus viviparus]|uniref:Adaptor complexe medium subunit family protein n=1 Tax=Dictyocaulus viviparus TaxID=29172 RepID=A0A0D8XR71_DICVI|nr:adaptor complexe medium subunit family protein [Dictyocaulus viviparus]